MNALRFWSLTTARRGGGVALPILLAAGLGVAPAGAQAGHGQSGTGPGIAEPGADVAVRRYVVNLAASTARVRVTGRPASTASAVAADSLTAVVRQYCVRCHSDRRMRGNLSLEHYEVPAAAADAATTEKIIRKLRAGMMPMPGARRPGPDTLRTLVETLETLVDEAARASPNPGGRPFQRLNRAEYESAVFDLLGLRIDAGEYLPLDTKSENFDNIADVQMMSPTLLSSYLNAANEITQLALGNPSAAPVDHRYTVSGYASQTERVEGAPFGTRGGLSVSHAFPADGDYVFTMTLEHTTTGDGFFGRIARFEQIEVSIDGARVALLDVDQWMTFADAGVISMETDPIPVSAGPHRVTAAFLKRAEGPVEDLLSPHDWSLADRHTGISGYGLTFLPHLRDLIIGGPTVARGVSDSPTRSAVLHCAPAAGEDGTECAEQILFDLATTAYRRPLDERDRRILMGFYGEGAAEGGFEAGIRQALQAILASPHFLFRFEEPPESVKAGDVYRLTDTDLATRLSFFLWAAPPDEELRDLAARDELSEPTVLSDQVARMLRDPRAESLGRRFASQWLRLQDLDKVHPDAFWFPDFDAQLAHDLRRETELFFNTLVLEDRSVLELYTADYTFLNERLARHYGIAGVVGDDFRRVPYPGDRRRGLLGHGSVLTLTSHAGRTSPVLRGKWVMEVLLGTPPPPPPPGVPELEETEDSEGARLLTTRERMERHRENPACKSCHTFMDPIGLALDNFDVTGRWRIRENGVLLDTRGEMYDGTPVQSPADLRQALLKRPEPLLRTFTANLMAYALGRRIEYTDQPTVRAIVRQAADQDHRMTAYIRGIVASDAFQMQRVLTPAVDRDGDPAPPLDP